MPSECNEAPPYDQPRRLNITELNTIARDVLGIDDSPFSALGNDYGAKVGLQLGTSERFLSDYFDIAHDVADRYVRESGLRTTCGAGSADCAKEVLAPVISRLLRRPTTPERLDLVASLTNQATGAGLPFDEALAAGVAAVLVSPDFFVIGTEVEVAPGIYPLDGYQLAERLALTLWNSVPDDELLEAAQNGDLETDAGIETQVNRMLNDPEKGPRFFEGFIESTFDLPSAQAVPLGLEGADEPEELAADLRQEAELLLWDTLDRDLGIGRLVSSDSTFANQRVAAHYGLDPVVGDEFVEVSTVGTSRTGGLLTMGATLAQEGDLIHRGVNVLQSFLCQILVPPDPEVVEAGLAEIPANATVRDEVAYRTTAPACSGCHSSIDPLGAAFEVYDNGGRDRAEYENGDPATYTSSFLGETIEGATDVSALLLEGNFSSCLSLQVLERVTSRQLSLGEPQAQCAVEQVLTGLGPDPGLRSIVTRSFLTSTFRARVVDAP